MGMRTPAPSRTPGRRGRPPSPQVAHRRIADVLRQRMVHGELSANAVLPSVRELARAYRVSVDTVWEAVQVLKQEGRIGRTPKRRLAVLPVYGALPAMTPQGALLEVITAPLHKRISSLNDQQLQLGIETGAGEGGVPLFILHEDHFRHALPAGILDWPLSGILVNGLVSMKVLRHYERVSIPVVLVDQPPGAAKVRAVCVDNSGSARELARRVLALGHRRIAFLRRFSFARKGLDPDSVEREAGFREACRHAGLGVPKGSVFTIFHTETPLSPSIQAAASAAAPYTAAICADHTIAHLVLQAAQAAGRRVPQDLSIVCYQGQVPEPRFTGMAIDFRELGYRAVRFLNAADIKNKILRVAPVWVNAGTLCEPGKSQKGGRFSDVSGTMVADDGFCARVYAASQSGGNRERRIIVAACVDCDPLDTSINGANFDAVSDVAGELLVQDFRLYRYRGDVVGGAGGASIIGHQQCDLEPALARGRGA